MFVLGIYDLSSTCIHSVATGILGYYGVAYCDYPRLNLILGSIALGSWMGCCITSMTLAVIRICDVCPTLKIKKLFEGRRIYFFIFMFWAYGMYAAFLSKPVTFSSSYMSWFFDPQIGNDILLQAFFFCIFHLIGSILYVYMQFVSAPEFLVLISQLAWQFGTGSVCIVYLTLNRSIQKSVLKMIFPKYLAKTNQVSVIASSDGRVFETAQVQMS
ncbi:hypothetical protein CAEBREN_30448 [Caenorhabditis brenneri]|uniref:7TM GPCR serpentine receptor class x (Srx) domain-containing protein n=1 Tax=Caenorhabditis brenneri TaxID=135651 RepID=G0PFB4_CAEBE|nr:hypothetical protein CAEBREN_30448 [Caenorhabditis brenneri]